MGSNIEYAQRLTGPQSDEVVTLTSRYVLARRRGDTVAAREMALRILAIYRCAQVEIAALQQYRDYIEETET